MILAGQALHARGSFVSKHDLKRGGRAIAEMLIAWPAGVLLVDVRPCGETTKDMSTLQTIKGIRDQLKAIKDAITVIEFKLSQLESESQAPGPERAAATGEAPAWS